MSMMKTPEPQKKESHVCTEEEPWTYEICDADRASHPSATLVDVMVDRSEQTWERWGCPHCGQRPWRLPNGAPAEYHLINGVVVHAGAPDTCGICFPPPVDEPKPSGPGNFGGPGSA